MVEFLLLNKYLNLKPRTPGNSFNPHFRLEGLPLNWLMNSLWCLILPGSSNRVGAALHYS